MKIRWLKSEQRAQNTFLNCFPDGKEPKNRTQLRKALKSGKLRVGARYGYGQKTHLIIYRKAWPKAIGCEQFSAMLALLTPAFDKLIITPSRDKLRHT